jgi:hypothetical protein
MKSKKVDAPGRAAENTMVLLLVYPAVSGFLAERTSSATL